MNNLFKILRDLSKTTYLVILENLPLFYEVKLWKFVKRNYAEVSLM